VIPALKGKLDGSSVRVPTPNVSCIDFTCVIERSASVEDINAAMKAAAEGPLSGVLGYETQPLVSTDYNHNPNSATFAADQTKVLPGNFVRVLAWYDNEWGFSNRMSDIAVQIARFL
jgi:glyceraldehyde 3-phosphate dehydrogenase